MSRPDRQTLTRLRDDVALFAEHVVGEPLWPHQVALAEDPARIRAVCSGRQAGQVPHAGDPGAARPMLRRNGSSTSASWSRSGSPRTASQTSPSSGDRYRGGMTMRWFVEELGPMTIVSRFDFDARIADFTCDAGATWIEGDRSLGYRMQSSLGVDEITEEQARELLTATP